MAERHGFTWKDIILVSMHIYDLFVATPEARFLWAGC